MVPSGNQSAAEAARRCHNDNLRPSHVVPSFPPIWRKPIGPRQSSRATYFAPWAVIGGRRKDAPARRLYKAARLAPTWRDYRTRARFAFISCPEARYSASRAHISRFPCPDLPLRPAITQGSPARSPLAPDGAFPREGRGVTGGCAPCDPSAFGRRYARISSFGKNCFFAVASLIIFSIFARVINGDY